MRDLTAPFNTVTITDGVSGDTHEVYYRSPTNAERVAYQAGLWERQGKKLVNISLATRLKLGSEILTGFKKGTIGTDGKAFASDPQDPDYLPNWRELLVQHAADIVAAVALVAFEGTGAAPGGVEANPLGG